MDCFVYIVSIVSIILLHDIIVMLEGDENVENVENVEIKDPEEINYDDLLGNNPNSCMYGYRFCD